MLQFQAQGGPVAVLQLNCFESSQKEENTGVFVDLCVCFVWFCLLLGFFFLEIHWWVVAFFYFCGFVFFFQSRHKAKQTFLRKKKNPEFCFGFLSALFRQGLLMLMCRQGLLTVIYS